MRSDNRKNNRERSAGFTLIELMVVVGIIIILMAILLPALAAAKQNGYRVSTQALLGGLSNNIEAYFTQFDAYPGPAPAGATAPASGLKLSGTQNLLIALSYSMWDTNFTYSTPAGYSALPIPPAVSTTKSVVVDVANISGPRDMSRTPPGAYPPYYNPSAKELSLSTAGTTSGTWYAGGVNGCAGTGFAFPTILDRFPDALPILYFRKTPGVDASVAFDASFNGTQSNPAVVSESPSTAVAAFYRAENSEYLDSTGLTSLNGTIYPQAGTNPKNGLGYSGLSAANSPNLNLAIMITGSSASTTLSAHGGFALVSASSDRTYGPNLQKAGKNDDIITIGGH